MASCGDDATVPSGIGGAGAGAGGAAAGSTGTAGSTGSAGTGGGGAGGAAGGAATASALHGAFTIKLAPAVEATSSAAMTTIIGKLADGPTPTPVSFMTTMEANGCKLEVPRVVFCSNCASGSLCVDDEICQAYPKAQTAGTVELSGIGTAPISMDPIAGNYQPKAGAALPHPPCTEGTNVDLSAAGGGFAPFTLSVKCIAPLVFEGAALALTRGAPLQLSWTPAAQPALSTIDVALDISHHGGTKGKISCDVPDTGSLEIPAAMTDALVDLGVAGFPTIVLTRNSVEGKGSTPLTENVKLGITSPVERSVNIPGLTSCASNDEQCPDGQTCQSDLTCK